MMLKSERRRRIDATLLDAVLYLYLLHQSGASQYEAVISLAEHSEYFGDAAQAFCQAVSDTDCGCSMFEALERLADATPSEKLREFVHGYIASVITTGSAASYLEDALSSLQEEKRVSQKRYLATLSVMAEVYLVLFVAAPMFFVIAAMVLGMISEVNPAMIGYMVFAVFPLGTVLFLLLLDSQEEVGIRYLNLEAPKSRISYRRKNAAGEEGMFRTLKTLDRKEHVVEFLRHPFKHFTNKPWHIFLVSVPLSLLSLAFSNSLYLLISVFLLIAAAPFAFFYSRRKRKMQIQESAMPDLLRQFADSVSQGQSLSDAVHTAANRRSPIQEKLQSMSDDILFGEPMGAAFFRFASRMRSGMVNRVVIQLLETSHFTIDASKTLVTLAGDVKSRLMMMQERRSEMSLYVVIIYLGFFVFLFVMVIMLTVFLDALSGVSGVSVSVYESILVGSVLVQGVCSGITAGKMGAGSVFAGVKHACVLLGIGVLVMVVGGFV